MQETVTTSEKMWIHDERVGATIESHQILIPKDVLLRIVDEALLERVKKLEQENEKLQKQLIVVSDEDAKDIIAGELKKFKAIGKKEIDAIDIQIKTKLPFDQINKVMRVLSSTGVVSENG